MLTQDRLKELLDYNSDTGIFTWKKRTSNRTNVGAVAGFRMAIGYVCIGIDGTQYYAHRLAWLYVHGEWPSVEIDHENSIGNDNRIKNLRPANSSQNKFNQRMRRDNKSGVKGVCWATTPGKWLAQLSNKRKMIFIGYYDTIEEAAIAVQKKRNELHGDFAHHG